MTEAAPAPSPAPVRRRRPARGVLIAGGIVLALGAAGVVAIPLGGWDTVELESQVVPELPIGDEYSGRHYSVAIEEAWTGDVLPDEWDEPDEGMTFVLVRAVMRNEWREPDTDAMRALTFDALDELPSYVRLADMRFMADGAHVTSMQPGVEAEVLLRWEVPAGSVVLGEPLTIGVIDGRPDRAILYSGTAWRDERIVVQTTVVPRSSAELEYPWES